MTKRCQSLRYCCHTLTAFMVTITSFQSKTFTNVGQSDQTSEITRRCARPPTASHLWRIDNLFGVSIRRAEVTPLIGNRLSQIFPICAPGFKAGLEFE